MKLVAIGFLGDMRVYVDITKEEAIARHNKEYPDYTVEDNNLAVKEIEVKDGKFWAYDVCNDG